MLGLHFTRILDWIQAGFRLDFGWISVGFGLILVWLDLDLA